MKKVGQSEIKSEVVLQEPPEQNEDVVPSPDEGGNESKESAIEGPDEQEVIEEREARDVAAKDAPPLPGKKRRKKVREVTEEEITPRPSIYPIGLALSMVVLLLGVAWSPIVLGIGVLLVIAALIGWSLERR